MSKKQPNPNYTPPATVRRETPAPAAATELITIPVSEYMYLQRVDALMDVLLLDSAYSSAHTIQAVKDAVLAMRMAAKGECEE